MSKHTTPTGQQYSGSTPYKLQGFRYLMAYHAAVCKLIQDKTKNPYIYIDLNCGAGYQPEYQEVGNEVLGSPIIALQELNKRGIRPICHFCDINEESLAILRQAIEELKLECTPNFWPGDNKDSLLQISQLLSHNRFQGLMYSDPNGKQDFPLKEIQVALQLPQMKKVDLLMNVATTYVRRWESNPKVSWEVYTLDEIVSGHGKKHVFVRQPDNPSLKWTFIYATNWSEQKDLKKINLYGVDRKVGKAILDHLFSPKSNPLPFMEGDGTIGIQGNLFDTSSSGSEECGDEPWLKS